MPRPPQLRDESRVTCDSRLGGYGRGHVSRLVIRDVHAAVVLGTLDRSVVAALRTRGLRCGPWLLDSTRSPPSCGVTGAATRKHCSRFDVVLGCPFDAARWRVWACILRHAAPRVPAEAPIVLEFDDPTKHKAGRHLAGVAGYRHGAGSARQEYRPLRGLNVVLGGMRVPLRRWPGHRVTIPMGLELSRQEEPAHQPHQPYRSRRALARASVDCGAAQLPGRPMRALADGG